MKSSLSILEDVSLSPPFHPPPILLSTLISKSISTSTSIHLSTYIPIFFMVRLKDFVSQCLQRKAAGRDTGLIHRLRSHIQDNVAVSEPCKLPCFICRLSIYAECREIHVWTRLVFYLHLNTFLEPNELLWIVSVKLFRCLLSC